MKIGITGANGFIGSLLVQKHLELGDEITVLSRKAHTKIRVANVCFGDLTDINSLHEFVKNIDILYHCAAEIIDESKMEATNVLGTENLIKAASGKIKHWVQLSSVGVYGPIDNGIISENQPYKPNNKYEKSKLKSDLLVLEATKKQLFTCTIIRPSNVFGVLMKNNSLFALIKTIDQGFYFFVGEKGASANYITDENVIEALYLGATNLNAVNKIYNISDWSSIEEFVGIISKYLKKPVPKYRIPLKPVIILAKITSFIPNNPLTVSRLLALCNTSKYSTSKIKNELHYKNRNTLDDGLRELVKEYMKRKLAPKNN